MDLLLEHIRRTAEREGIAGNLLRKYVESFLKSSKAIPETAEFRLDSRDTVTRALEAVYRCLLLQDFHCGKGPDHLGRHVAGYLERQYDRNSPWLASIDGLLYKQLEVRFDVSVRVDEGPRVILDLSRHLPTWIEELRGQVEQQLARAIDGGPREPRTNVFLAPGEPLEHEFNGVLHDYSGCGTIDDVQDLVKKRGDDKALPLGIFCFDHKPDLKGTGSLLCLGKYRTKAPMMYNGTLIVAPQNSGKTELIVRWAQAANRAGYNTLIVDVKGSLYERLKEGLQGRVFHFTTDPDPSVECHRINLLEGLRTTTAQGRREIEQLAEALIPDGGADGEDRERRQLRVNWLSAMINIVKLREFFYVANPEYIADLGTVYEMASSENYLFQIVNDIRAGMARAAARKIVTPRPDVDYWLNELAILLTPDEKRLPQGQREPRYSYQSLTVFLALALRPFSRIGTLYGRTSGHGDFSLKALDGAAQVTIVLAAREQDGEDSRTVVSAAIKRLEQILFDRRRKEPDRDVLLLLDETRRIRAFRAGEYITFARDAKAGCVLVYQSITQIKSDAEIVEILENVGTQIYLRSMVGETARRFIGMLPKRYRPSYSRSKAAGPDGETVTVQTGQQEVEYLTTSELYRMPAGEYPALVYIKDHGAGKPFLVDMTGTSIKQAWDGLHSQADTQEPARPQTREPKPQRMTTF
jgi:hypothetical protein